MSNPSAISKLISSILGDRTGDLLATLDLDAALARDNDQQTVSRTGFATALNALLFNHLLARAPTGAAFVADQRTRGQRIAFDHGALRTIRFADRDTGFLPAGQDAFSRILAPLGYQIGGTYPLPKLKMTGHAWTHQDMPEQLPQFFVSELHVDRFDDVFAEAATRVFGASRDPLDDAARALLDCLAGGARASVEMAIAAFPAILSAFERCHEEPAESDYEILLAQSTEAAWIATEGNAFNHATSRVDDVAAEAERQRSRGLAVKDKVEVSQSGGVRQTAFKADPVMRRFRRDERMIEREVPGSFYEIITREIHPETGLLDLSFDSSNATAIFKMTQVA